MAKGSTGFRVGPRDQSRAASPRRLGVAAILLVAVGACGSQLVDAVLRYTWVTFNFDDAVESAESQDPAAAKAGTANILTATRRAMKAIARARANAPESDARFYDAAEDKVREIVRDSFGER